MTKCTINIKVLFVKYIFVCNLVFNWKDTKIFNKCVFTCMYGGGGFTCMYGALRIHLEAKRELAWKSLRTTGLKHLEGYNYK